ncbi:MAG: orotidine 5'-phosphate decarboxylase [Candidatus Caldarchaeum sp.]|uniref:Orotidine 5'-phosphate decarboxylase n=1 Tax=Caldiarchaeum subterraneum TaxID=311458 RepID=A0A7J3VU86_CALS0
MSAPLKTFEERTGLKKSVLCLGLDPDPSTHPDPRQKLLYCLNMVEKVSDYFAAVKINENFVRDLCLEDHQRITSLAAANGLVSIYDCKIGDIGNSSRAGLQLVKRMGYDFSTFNPILGNVEEVAREASRVGVGVLALLHPSNPESRRYYRAVVDGRKLYELILEDVCSSSVEGVVLGLHPELTTAEIAYVRERLGDERIILFPGVGVQGGKPEAAIMHGGRRILVNVGRAILGSPDPVQAAARLSEQLRRAPRDI